MAFENTMVPNNKPTPVFDQQATHVLEGIYTYLSKQSIQSQNLARQQKSIGDALNDSNSESKKNYQDEKVRSMAAERKNRAITNALFGKVDKALSFMETLSNLFKSLFNNVINVVKDGFKKAMNKYDDLSSSMRNMNIAHEDKLAIQTLASKSNIMDGAFRVSKDAINQSLTVFARENNAYFRKLAAEQDTKEAQWRMNIAAEMKEQGWDEQTIVKAIMATKDSDLARLEDVVRKTSDPTGGAESRLAIQKLIQSDFESIKNDFTGSLNSIVDSTRKFAAVGTGINKESTAALVKLGQDIASNNIQNIDKTALKSALGVSGDKLSSPETILNSVTDQLKKIQELAVQGNTKAAHEQASKINDLIVVLGKSGEVDDALLNDLKVALAAAEGKNLAITKVKTEEELKQMDKDNTPEGWLPNAFGVMTDKFNAFTADLGLDGGLLGKLSVNLDEMFGGNVNTGDVVADGFTNVLSVLKSIRFSMLASSVVSFFKSGLGATLLTKLTSFLGIGSAGTAIANAAGTAATGAATGAAGTAATGAAGTAATGAAAKKTGLLSKAKNFKMPKGVKKAGIFGLAVAGGMMLFGGSSEAEAAELQNQNAAVNEMSNMAEMSGDFYSDLLSLVADIRNSLYRGVDEIAASHEAMEELPGEVYAASAVLNMATNPLEKKVIESIGKNAARSTEKAATEAVTQVSKSIGTSAAKAGLKTGVKALGKAAGPAGLVLDAGISVYEVAQNMSEANKQEATGKDLTKELYKKRVELQKAQKANDAEAVKRITMEVNAIESAIDAAADAQENATDQAVVSAVGGASGLAMGLAGAAAGAAIGSIVPGIGTVIGGAVGGAIGGIAGMLGAGAAAEAAVADTPEQRAEKIRLKREEYQAELRERERLASEKGVAESVAVALVASAQDQKDFENKLEGIVQMQKMGLSEAELEFLAENSANTEDMRNLTKQILSDPSKVYSNVGAIAVDISAMRTNLMSLYHRVDEIEDGLKATLKFADGGVVTNATPAVVGEDGKEAIVPLEKPEEMQKVLSNLTSAEKLALIKALAKQRRGFTWNLIAEALQQILGIGKSATDSSSIQDMLSTLSQNGVPGDDPATLEKILGYAGPYRAMVYERLLHGWQGKTRDGFKQRKKWFDEALSNAANQEGRDLIRGTYAERALDYGVSQLGKPYILRSLGKIGYVCNELVNACVQASGFDMGKFRVHGVKATFANIRKGKYSGEEYPNFRIRDDLTPETAIPGMVFFQDARKNQEGGFQPGHIGLVYYGHQKLHSSGGSADYTKEGFLPKWQTPCRGVTVTPFDGSNYVIGEFPGMFEQASGEWKPPANSPVPFGPVESLEKIPSTVKSASDTGLISSEEITNLMVQTSGVSRAIAADYAAQAIKMMDGKNKEEVIAILMEIAKYLKGIAVSSISSNKQPMMSVNRPAMSVYQ